MGKAALCGTLTRKGALDFLSFVSALREGAGLSLGIEDPRLPECTLVPAAARAVLLSDFTS